MARRSYLLLLALLAACSFQPQSLAANVTIGRSVPSSWTPSLARGLDPPQIVGVRFSSLDIELGSDWNGDVVTSTDVDDVRLRTTLFEVGTIRTAPGRFHFEQHVIDDPAFIVRPYTLEVTAHDARGRSTVLPVPFRIRGHGVGAANHTSSRTISS